MAANMICWFFLMGSVSLANSEGFLSANVNKQDVEHMFLEEMAAMSTSARIEKLIAEFSVTFPSLPKNEHGNIDNPTVRYAIHRYFSHNFGWQVKGLSSSGDAWNSSSSTTFMKSRVSGFIFELFDKRLSGKGFDINNLAVFASVMEDLVNQEAVTIVDQVFHLLKLPSEDISPDNVDRVVAAFNAASMMGGFRLETYRDVVSIEREIDSVYPRFYNTKMWMTDVRHEFDRIESPRRNPFVQHQYSYNDIVGIATRVMYSLGFFEMAECRGVKNTLVDMDVHAVGRVPLADYYASTGIDFHESWDFLRDVGSLDTSNPKMPSVIIPNILGISGNCAMTTEYYSVCCFDECEGLMQQLEQDIKAPSATPARIAQIVSNLETETVEAPRNLSTLLTTRLEEIANIHGGEVLLHGRLFMQWMHHAYPRECRFPHVSGTVNADAVWEEASFKDKQVHGVKNPLQRDLTQEDSIKALPWSSVEELVAGHQRTGSKHKSGIMEKLRFAVGLLALVSMMIPLIRSSKACITPEKPHSVCV